ncbi:Uncharacterised protein [Streptococcus suis]|nr:Uncharacterised protein [Streptococcus suis]
MLYKENPDYNRRSLWIGDGLVCPTQNPVQVSHLYGHGCYWFADQCLFFGEKWQSCSSDWSDLLAGSDGTDTGLAGNFGNLVKQNSSKIKIIRCQLGLMNLSSIITFVS